MIRNGMRSILVYIFTCLLLVESSAQFFGDNSQNLVKNPSFEEKTGCPDYTNFVDKQEYMSHLIYWTDVLKEFKSAPTFYTYDPDCNLTSIQPQARFHKPHTGENMVEIWCWSSQLTDLKIFSQSHVFLRGELNAPLVSGRRYFVSYYAKAFDTDAREMEETVNGGINSFGIHFCDTQFWFGHSTPKVDSLLYSMDVIKPQLISGKYLLDTLNYEEVTGIYQAKGGERYITIGNFLNNIASKVKLIPGSGINSGMGIAYKLDDITIATLPYLGPDTCLAANGIIELKVPDYINLPDYRFLWSTGKKAKSISINKPGTYWVEYEMGYTKVRDSIVIKSSTQRIDLNNLGDHQTVCDDSLELAIKWPDASNYAWNNGSNASSITARKAGTYTVSFQRSNGCLYRESVTLDFPKPFVEGIDSTYCSSLSSSQYVKVKPNGNYEYLYWYGKNGERSSAGENTRLGSYAGTVSYYVEANLKGCTYMDTVITSLKRYGVPYFNKDRVLCSTPDQKKENRLDLGPWITGEKTEVLWSTGSTDSFIYINQTDTYWVQTKNQFGCSYTDKVYYEYFTYALNDTLLCLGDTLHLHLDSPSIIETVSWYANDKKQNQWTNLKEISIRDTGKYAARIRLYDPTYHIPFLCNISDTFHFSYDSIQQVLGNDTTACNAQSLVLSTLEDFDEYRWSTGATGKELELVAPLNQVWVKVARNNCIATDTLLIAQDSLRYSKLIDTSICPSDSIELSVKTQDQIEWQNGSKEKNRTVQKAEVYRFSLANDKCVVYDSIGLSHLKVKKLIHHHLGDSICGDESYSFELISDDSISYFLNDELLTDFKALRIGEYMLKADNGCEFMLDTFQVAQQNCELIHYIPNAFSPNSDGINDEWKPIFTQPLDFYRLDVFDRSGVRVFWSDDPNETWQGEFKAKPLPIGLYTFVISVKYTSQNEAEELLLKGGVVIVK